MKTFFQLREENSGETLKVSREIFEAVQDLMSEGSIDPDDHEENKEIHHYHKTMAADGGGAAEKISKDHYRDEGERGGTMGFSYKHGNNYGTSVHSHGDSFSKIHKGVKSNNPHLSDHEVKHTAKVIHNHLSSQDY